MSEKQPERVYFKKGITVQISEEQWLRVDAAWESDIQENETPDQAIQRVRRKVRAYVSAEIKRESQT